MTVADYNITGARNNSFAKKGALICYYMVDFVYFVSQNKDQGNATAKVDF